MIAKKQTEKEVIGIPIEIFLEVCKMIQMGSLGSKVISSNETTGEAILEVCYSPDNTFQKAAIENIHEAVGEWNHYRYGEEDPDEVELT
jgi:hypothetical protein